MDLNQKYPNISNKKSLSTNRWLYSIYLGLFAGLIWGLVKMCEHFLKFTVVYPGLFMADTVNRYHWTVWQGYVAGILYFMLFSVVASLLYVSLAAKVKARGAGLLYGALIWVLIYVWIGPCIGTLPGIAKLDRNTLISDFCLFLLWGLFIGYSVTMEYTSFTASEPKKGVGDGSEPKTEPSA